MNAELLCRWLNLPGSAWPTDPFTLLGLKPGEIDAARLDQIVHERMAKLRCYQLSHPEETTEGMNRLAQAYLQLMEMRPALPASSVPAPTVPTDVRAEPIAPDWRQAPPPVRGTSETATTPSPLVETKPEAVPTEELVTFTLVPPKLPTGPTPITEKEVQYWAVESEEARNGLATLTYLVDRIYQTRGLLHAWQRLGRYLATANRKRMVDGAAQDFAKRVAQVVKNAIGYPGFFAEPGKPGYRVVALARLSLTPEMLASMDRPQRELLANDWANGEKVLLAHRRFLYEKFRRLRRRGAAYLGARAVWNTVRERPVLVAALLIFAASALAASIYITFFSAN